MRFRDFGGRPDHRCGDDVADHEHRRSAGRSGEHRETGSRRAGETRAAGRESWREALQSAADSRRPARSRRLLEQRDLHAARACRQNVTKEFYTPEEFSKIRRERQATDEEQTTPDTTADVHYDFTQFGLDKSQHTIVQNLRTSQIIDPPDGRMPPTTPKRTQRAQAPRRSASSRAVSTIACRTCRPAHAASSWAAPVRRSATPATTAPTTSSRVRGTS